MTTLHITRGLPASGKTTWARAWAAEDREHRARVNRDELRRMLDDGVHLKGVTEQRVLAVRDEALTRLLRSGYDVVCDDTNLPQWNVRALAKLARGAGAEFEVHDFTHVPLETCLERDAARAEPVGEERIRDLHMRFLAGRKLPLPVPDERPSLDLVPYEPRQGTPKAVLVDIDGTTANGYLFQIETGYRLTVAGARIRELPTTFTDREYGTSKMAVVRTMVETQLRVTWWGLCMRAPSATRLFRRTPPGRYLASKVQPKGVPAS